MKPLPEAWTLLVENETVQDPSTGNLFPSPPTEVPWTGLLQQRQLSPASAVGNTEFTAGHVVSSYVLLLDPGIEPLPTSKDAFRDADGAIYRIQGRPRQRRMASGSRRPAYIAANVRMVSDMKE
ncbi:hypothetical protein [Rhodococcus xishaensis]|uniref:Uncharacterized protein n=1 Tax=Rhodococcus xishaensis TaxID=2487364 RepID=A0A3S3E0B2_9NOCA|nr:hypothetical protein [Rhodococcus xishaensis]RVW03013.1 hypothetical protein EGT50_09900 [Rhodococcus xishaensis]